MDNDETTTIVETPELPLKHQFGKMAVGSIAAFAANALAERAYVKALEVVRARKGS